MRRAGSGSARRGRRPCGGGRRLDAAARLGRTGSGVELAARGPADQARYLALDRDQDAPPGRIRLRDALDQGLRIGMRRCGEHGLRVAELDQAAEIHDADPIGDVAHDWEIVGDHQVAEPMVALQVSIRFRISPWTDTSRPAVGSSAITSRGRRARARATPTLRACPPDSSCG